MKFKIGQEVKSLYVPQKESVIRQGGTTSKTNVLYIVLSAFVTKTDTFYTLLNLTTGDIIQHVWEKEIRHVEENQNNEKDYNPMKYNVGECFIFKNNKEHSYTILSANIYMNNIIYDVFHNGEGIVDQFSEKEML